MAFYRGPNIVTNGLVLYLDAANAKSYVSGSTTWTDLSRNGNSMSLINTPTFRTTYNGGIVFNGSTQYANIAGTENQITSSAVTIEVAFSVTSNTFTAVGGNTTNQYIVFRQNTRTSNFEGYAFNYSIGSGTSLGRFYSSATSTTGTQAATTSTLILGFNIPMIVTTIFNSSFISVYVNGVFTTQAVTGFALNYNTNHKLTLGRANATGNIFDGYFNGVIYSYKQYNRTLTASEILQNYNALKSRFIPT